VDNDRRLYAETVRPACREEDPSQAYWPGSPSAGPDEDDPCIFEKGDIHYWDVWHAGQPFENYYTTEPRFVSEFGYQSFPSLDSLRTVVEEEDFNPTSPMMEHHQRNPGGNTTILSRMADYFRFPFSFSDFVYLSQVQHGVAMDTAIEYWRRRKPTTMGALYWQLNVLWPVASWASLEYDGKWKAQQYMARRQFAPVLVSWHPEYEGDVETLNEQAGDGGDFGDIESLTCWITSDRTEAIEGTLEVEILPLAGGEPVIVESLEVDLEAHGSESFVTIERADLPEGVHPRVVMLRAPLDGDEASYLAEGSFADYKPLALPEDDLEVTIDGNEVTVASEEGATLFVELDVGTIRGAFSDNYFTLAPGEERTVSFESYDGKREAVVEAHIEDELSVRHLRETY
jgi:beta-mannosidase